MTEPATFLALAAEVEAGNGPDRALDVRIHSTLGLDAAMEEPPGWPWPRIDRFAALPYTASVDAALALLREKLPGWAAIRMTTLHSPTGRASSDVEIRPMFDEQIVFHCGEAPTLPRAIVAAVLRAAARGDG